MVPVEVAPGVVIGSVAGLIVANTVAAVQVEAENDRTADVVERVATVIQRLVNGAMIAGSVFVTVVIDVWTVGNKKVSGRNLRLGDNYLNP
jgi:hypothetical protein